MLAAPIAALYTAVVPASPFDLPRLKSEIRPFRLHYFPRLRSTNDHAAVLRARRALFAPAVVLTATQTAGRGRGNNQWASLPGALTVTFAFPVEEHLSPLQLPLVAGLAVRHAAAELTGDNLFALKWPNDVLHEGRKVAGLLCERVHKIDLIGVGLNVLLDPADLPEPLRERATSLAVVSRRPLDMTQALLTLASHLRTVLARRGERPLPELLNEYNQHHALTGQRVSITHLPHEPPLTGTCEGIDSIGRLLIRNRAGLHRVLAGHVNIL